MILKRRNTEETTATSTFKFSYEWKGASPTFEFLNYASQYTPPSPPNSRATPIITVRLIHFFEPPPLENAK